MKNIQSFQFGFFFLLATIFSINLSSQTLGQERLSKPVHQQIRQNASNSQNPGVYSQVVLASNTVLSPGDSLEIRYYITGYGFIDYQSAKLQYSQSAEITDQENSALYCKKRS